MAAELPSIWARQPLGHAMCPFQGRPQPKFCDVLPVGVVLGCARVSSSVSRPTRRLWRNKDRTAPVAKPCHPPRGASAVRLIRPEAWLPKEDAVRLIRTPSVVVNSISGRQLHMPQDAAYAVGEPGVRRCLPPYGHEFRAEESAGDLFRKTRWRSARNLCTSSLEIVAGEGLWALPSVIRVLRHLGPFATLGAQMRPCSYLSRESA